MFPVSCIPKGIPYARFVGALDGLTTNLAGVWWIAKRLLSSYTGPLIRVRRSSDSLETPIGYTADGSLDTASLLAWCGTGDGFITVIYNQLGGTNITQTIAIRQPKIVASGSLVTTNSVPAGDTYGTTIWMDAPQLSGSAMTLYTRTQNTAGGSFWGCPLAKFGTSSSVEFWPESTNNVDIGAGSTTRKGTLTSSVAITNSNVITAVSAASSYTLRIGGVTQYTDGTNVVGFGATPTLFGQNGLLNNMRQLGLIWYQAQHTSTEWSQVEAAL